MLVDVQFEEFSCFRGEAWVSGGQGRKYHDDVDFTFYFQHWWSDSSLAVHAACFHKEDLFDPKSRSVRYRPIRWGAVNIWFCSQFLNLYSGVLY